MGWQMRARMVKSNYKQPSLYYVYRINLQLDTIIISSQQKKKKKIQV